MNSQLFHSPAAALTNLAFFLLFFPFCFSFFFFHLQFLSFYAYHLGLSVSIICGIYIIISLIYMFLFTSILLDSLLVILINAGVVKPSFNVFFFFFPFQYLSKFWVLVQYSGFPFHMFILPVGSLILKA